MEEELKQIWCFSLGSVVVRKRVISRMELGNPAPREGFRGVTRNMILDM